MKKEITKLKKKGEKTSQMWITWYDKCVWLRIKK